MARPKARTAIERGLLGGESGYMCTNCISRILVILLLGVDNVRPAALVGAASAANAASAAAFFAMDEFLQPFRAPPLPR